MTRPLLLLLASLTVTVATAEDLVTIDGKTYTNITVTKVEPDGLRIVHASGTAKVPFEKLSTEIQKKHGYDPFNAYDHEQAEKARLAAIDKAEALRAAKREKENANFKAAKEFEKLQQIARSHGKMMKAARHLESVHVADGHAHLATTTPGAPRTRGIVAELSEGYPTKLAVKKGKTKIGERDGWDFIDTKILAYVEGNGIQTSINPDSGTILSLSGEVILYPIGQARFIGLDGNKRTMLRYTDNLEDATRFYHKHGHPPTPTCREFIKDFSEDPKPAPKP